MNSIDSKSQLSKPAETITPPLDLTTDKVLSLIRPYDSRIPWERVSPDDQKKIDKYNRMEEEGFDLHESERRQMVTQLTENPQQASLLLEQFSNQANDLRQQLEPLKYQILDSSGDEDSRRSALQAMEQISQQIQERDNIVGMMQGFVMVGSYKQI